MTDLDIYQPPAGGQLEQYQARMIMTPEQAKALDAEVRRCTAAVLREGTDYGVIPGTNGEKSLWRPGAQKLLQWFSLGFTCERVEVERDEQGRKHGITYKCTVTRRLPDGTLDVKATCEGTADYDEDKFYQTAEERQRKAEDAERRFAQLDKRPPRPTKWQGLPEYRAPWNALMKRAQKRAIVGAVVDATAAGGIFSDREEDDHAPAPQDDGPSWYEQALEQAVDFTDIDVGRSLYVEAAEAHKKGLCTRRQQDRIQNIVKKRGEKLASATVTDVEDLAARAPRLVSGGVSVKPDPTPPAAPAATATATASSTAPAADGRSDAGQMVEDEPGTVSEKQLASLHILFGGFGFGGSKEDRERKLAIAETIAGRTLDGPNDGRTSKNLSWTEARRVIGTLEGFDGRAAADVWMAAREQNLETAE